MDPNQAQPYTTTVQKPEYPLVTLPRNSVDPRFNQTMNPHLGNWNTGTFHEPNSALSVSRINPYQFESSSTAPMTRLNASGPATTPNSNGINETANTDSKFSCSKFVGKLTSTKVLFFMVGLILCAVPLAVMTTLWVNARDATTTSAPANPTSSITLSTSPTTSLPIQCYTYSTLNDPYRNYQNGYGCCYTPYDTSSYLTAGWFRISGSAGTQLYTSPINSASGCGESYPGYFNGTLPSTPGSLTTGNVCFYSGSACSYSLSPISVINCNGYYIFYLIPTSSVSYKYCTV